MQRFRCGDVGQEVAEIRATLSALGFTNATHSDDMDLARFDEDLASAVRAFQQHRGLITDGIVGIATWRAMHDATHSLGSRTLSWMVSKPMTGDDIYALQERLLELGYDAGRPDGVFSGQTESALRNFQRDYGMVSDGICGVETVRALRQLAPKVKGGRPVLLREQERVRSSGPRLRGKRIVIDPGHGGADRGIVVDGIAEADLMWDLARRLEGRMMATGMEAILSRGQDQNPSDTERAAYANESGADLFLSLHTDANRSPLASGIASFHFGSGSGHGTASTVGEALAGFIQRELSARTGMLDCHSHPRSWDTLRLTRCPAVRLEIGYQTNADDLKLLSDPGFRDIVAEGIMVAVKRLYLLGENDQPTGTFTFADLLKFELTKPKP
jgi:N-acetylmuramoyl-L-alanine amidase